MSATIIPINRAVSPMVTLDEQQERRYGYLVSCGRETQAVREGLAEWECSTLAVRKPAQSETGTDPSVPSLNVVQVVPIERER